MLQGRLRGGMQRGLQDVLGRMRGMSQGNSFVFVTGFHVVDINFFPP